MSGLNFDTYFDVSSTGVLTPKEYDTVFERDSLDIVFPSTINGKEVKAINKDSGMYNLFNYISYPSKVSFASGSKLKEFRHKSFNYANIETMDCPPLLKKIGRESFYASKLKEFYMPDSVKTLGHSAFAYCSNLEKVHISESIYEISERCFCGSKKIKEINIPKSVSVIYDSAFANCSSLSGCINLENVTILSQSAFNSTAIEEVKFPKKISLIGNSVFANCKNLKKVIYPEYHSVPYRIFNGCGQLESVELPEGVKYIDGRAFSRCDSLESIQLPKSLEKITPNAFMNNIFGKIKNLELGKLKIVYNGTEADWNKVSGHEILDGCPIEFTAERHYYDIIRKLIDNNEFTYENVVSLIDAENGNVDNFPMFKRIINSEYNVSGDVNAVLLKANIFYHMDEIISTSKNNISKIEMERE